MGIGPTSKAWEALVLPLNYTRKGEDRLQRPTGGDNSLNRVLYPRSKIKKGPVKRSLLLSTSYCDRV